MSSFDYDTYDKEKQTECFEGIGKFVLGNISINSFLIDFAVGKP